MTKLIKPISKTKLFTVANLMIITLLPIAHAQEKIDMLGTIRFLNQDIMHGKFISADYNKGVTYQFINTKNKVTINAKNLQSISLPEHTTTNKNLYKIYLTNKNIIYGKLTELTKNNLILETKYAGKLTIPRCVIKYIKTPINLTNNLYVGPNNIKEWTINGNKKSWEYKNNHLYCKYANIIIGKDLKLPESVSISFVAECKNRLNFSLGLYADKQLYYGSNNYQLQFNGNYVTIRKYTSEKNLRNNNCICSFNLPEHGKKFNFTIFANKKSGKFALLCNNKIVKQWQDPAGMNNPNCTKINFSSHTKDNLKISNIIVSQWNGKISLHTNTNNNITKETIQLVNGDKVSGKILNIKEQKLKIKTNYATLTVPTNRICKIYTNKKNLINIRRNKHDIKAIFQNGNYIIMELIKIENNTIYAKSENFGVAQFKLSFFKEIQLNIYDDRLKIKPTPKKQPKRNLFFDSDSE